MRWLKGLLVAALSVAILLVGILFTTQNTHQAPLDLLLIQLPAASISVWVLGAFALGAVVGLVVSFGIILRLRGRILKASSQLHRCQKEVNSLRTLAVKDKA